MLQKPEKVDRNVWVVEDFIESVGDDLAIVKELSDMFSEESRQMMAVLRDSIQRRDDEETDVRDWFHSNVLTAPACGRIVCCCRSGCAH